MQDDVKAYLREHGIHYTETQTLSNVLGDLDALYVTRMQSEWDSANESRAVDLSRYSVGPRELEGLKRDAIVMHPLPRGPEIDRAVDEDPRAMYWRQERNGMWMRVAVLLRIFREDGQV
jgi:aspartate carbamoyltransferase catalytic subunit